nr:hypothetical protein [Tanacetum cinerariifolium]
MDQAIEDMTIEELISDDDNLINGALFHGVPTSTRSNWSYGIRVPKVSTLHRDAVNALNVLIDKMAEKSLKSDVKYRYHRAMIFHQVVDLLVVIAWAVESLHNDVQNIYEELAEPDNSLSMGDEHLDTISATKSDEFIESSVENLIPNLSESEGEHECDVPACDDFTTFSNIFFDVDDDFSSSNDQSFYDEDIPKEIYSNPLFDEEIVSMKIDPHHFNVESDLIESLLNSLIISSSSKIDSLLDEFAGELTLLKSIPPGINETDCDPEEETHLIEKLLYDNSSLRPPEEFISKNFDTAIESFSSCPIPIEDNDSFMEEIDLSFTADDPMPPGIEEDDYDSKRGILILEELLSNDSLSLPEIESFHFDIHTSSRPPAKPPD